MKPAQQRTWDAAIQAVQQTMFELASEVPLSDEQDRILTTAFLRCGKLTAKNCLHVTPTNGELARKYRISPRTVRNWRKAGCPFEAGQWRVLDWLARRRYAPAGAKAKFEEQLERRKFNIAMGPFWEAKAKSKKLKRLCLLYGVDMPDWLRRI